MILNRIQPFIDPLLMPTQNGFRKSKSTLYNILTLRRIIEGINAKNLPLAIVFIDFSKAFDSIHREQIFQILSTYVIPAIIINAIKLISLILFIIIAGITYVESIWKICSL